MKELMDYFEDHNGTEYYDFRLFEDTEYKGMYTAPLKDMSKETLEMFANSLIDNKIERNIQILAQRCGNSSYSRWTKIIELKPEPYKKNMGFYYYTIV